MFEGFPVVRGLLLIHWVVRIKGQITEKDRRDALELVRNVISIAPARRNGVGWVSSLAQAGLLLLFFVVAMIFVVQVQRTFDKFFPV